MFAFLFSKEMDPFYGIIFSFPTVFFTFFVFLCTIYWLIAVLGLVDIDVLDFDSPDIDPDLAGGSEHSTVEALTGLMMKLGLHGVPVTIVLSLVSILGWIFSYYTVYFLFAWVPQGILSYLLGIPTLLASLYVAALITGKLINPLRPFFATAEQHTEKKVLGQVAIVRTLRVDQNFGEAIFADGGAGLILKVRSLGNVTFSKGDRVILLEHLKEEGVYRVISEQEFYGD